MSRLQDLNSHQGRSGPRVDQALSALTMPSEKVLSREEGRPYRDDRGIMLREVITTRYIARRTFLRGRLKAKYWGWYDKLSSPHKDVGDYYDITLYESDILVKKEDIVVNPSAPYPDYVAALAQQQACQGLEVTFTSFSQTTLVVGDSSSSPCYQIDLYEPMLFNPRIHHALHQSAGVEVFGTLESEICGYLLDYQEVVEKTVEEVLPVPPAPPADVDSRLTTTIETGGGEPLPRKSPLGRIGREILSGGWVLIILLLVAFSILLMGFGFPLAALLTVGLAGLLMLVARRGRRGFPRWLSLLLLLLMGVFLWRWLSPLFMGGGIEADPTPNANPGSPVLSTAEEFVNEGRSGNGGGEAPRNLSPAGSQPSDGKAPTPATSPNDARPPRPTEPAQTASETQEGQAKSPMNSQVAAFDEALRQGLKAVEEEEYERAQGYFRKAYQANPTHPKLQELAALYRKMGDQRCQEFTKANAETLKYIPNIYYQYAATLTQTVPQKCD